jgi:hypothetical protein
MALLIAAILLAIAVNIPWWVWLIAIVVLMKRPWRRHPASWRHGHHGPVSPGTSPRDR